MAETLPSGLRVGGDFFSFKFQTSGKKRLATAQFEHIIHTWTGDKASPPPRKSGNFRRFEMFVIVEKENNRGEIQCYGYGDSEAVARQAAFEFVNARNGRNVEDLEFAGGVLLNSQQCTNRLQDVLSMECYGDNALAVGWAMGSLYFNEAGLLDARYLSREEFESVNGKPLPTGGTWVPSGDASDAEITDLVIVED